MEGETTMAEKMLVTQALDEKALLMKKIYDKIEKAHFVDFKKKNEELVAVERVSEEEFNKRAQAAYQQINDLIDRFGKIDAAIVESNAKTMINTSYGQFSVASAISLKNRLRGKGVYAGKTDFETRLYEKMQDDYLERVVSVDEKNSNLDDTAENMRLSILGKDTKKADDRPLDVVDKYVSENTSVLVDPLEVKVKMDYLANKKATLIRELETQIKVANATTFIEI